MLRVFLNSDNWISNVLAGIFPHNVYFDALFAFLSLSGLTVIVWVIVLVFFIIFEEKRHKEFILYFLVAFLTTSFIVNIVIKNIVRRERPYIVKQLNITSCPKDFSFPSGHAAGAFAGAVVFTAFDKKRRSIYYTLAFLVSYSRVYLQCHYFADVVFGALLGYAISKTLLLSLTYKQKI